jgi:predicted DNA-binding transcriptional regulator YafY
MSTKPKGAQQFQTAARLIELLDDLDAGKDLTLRAIERRFSIKNNAARDYIKFLGTVRSLDERTVRGTKHWSLAARDPAERGVVHVAALELALAALEWLDGTPYYDQLRDLRRDIAGKLPLRDRDHAQHFVSAVRVRPFAQPENRPMFARAASTVLEAIRDHHPCDMHYRRLDGLLLEYRIEPCEIVLQADCVYVLARKMPSAEVRVFELEGIEQVTCVESATFVPPATSDGLSRRLVDSIGVYIHPAPPVRVRLAVGGPVLVELRRRRIHPSQSVGSVQPSGWAEVSFHVSLSVPLRQWILARIPDVRVLEPAHLSEELRAAAREFAETDPSGGGTDPPGI